MASKAMIGLGLNENVSQGLEKIEESIEGVSSKSKELEVLGKRIDDLGKKSLPVKRELKQLEDIMANMNLQGLTNTDEFTRAATRAGELKDALIATHDATRQYGDGIMYLNSIGDTFTAIAATGTIATGVMGMFGVENEKVGQILLKVQSAQSILNGCMALANALDKDSALMLKIKQIRMAANTAMTQANTVATTANTVANTANTLGTKKSTVAQTAWNVAKAVAKALMGDFTGLLLVGVGAVATYAAATASSTEKTKQNNEAIESARQKQEEYNKSLKDTANNTVIPLYTSFIKLRASWKLLNTEAEKKKFIKEYAAELKNLGVEINNISDAENLFINNQEAFIKSIKLRAEAAVLTKKLEKLLEDNHITNSVVSNNDPNTLPNAKYSLGELGVNDTANQIAEVYKQIDEIQKQFSSSITSTSSTTNTEVEAVEGSLADLESRLTKLQNDYKKGLLPNLSATDYIKSISDLEKEIENKKISLGILVKPAEGSLAYINERLKELEDKKNQINIKLNPDAFNDIVREIQSLEKEKIEINATINSDEIKKEISDIVSQALKTDNRQTYDFSFLPEEYAKEADDVVSQLDKIIDAREQLNDIINDPNSSDDKIKLATSALAAMESQYQSLTAEAAKFNEVSSQIKERQTEFENFTHSVEDINNVVSSIDAVKSSFESFSDAISNGEDAWDIMMAGFETGMSILSAVTTVMEIINAIQDAQNIKKQLSATTLAQETAAHTANSVAQSAETATTTALGIAQTAAIAPTIGLATAVKKLAASQIFLAHASIPFAGPAIAAAGVATMEATLAAIQAFANGGIVTGSSTIGDHMIARVNAGEMILNDRQQANLFKMLNEGAVSNKGNVNVSGKVKIRGKDMDVLLSNYDGVKKVTGHGLKF